MARAKASSDAGAAAEIAQAAPPAPASAGIASGATGSKVGAPAGDATGVSRDFSARRIIGFACNQAFVFYLFYMGLARNVQVASVVLPRADLVCTLLFMVIGFAAARALGPEHIGRLFSRPLLYIYAVVAAAGFLLPLAFPDGPLQWAVAQGALTGIPIAYLLTAWGRTFGSRQLPTAVVEVFLGSLVAGLVCLVFSLAAQSQVVMAAFALLPLASVVNLQVPPQGDAREAAVAASDVRKGWVLSFKVLAGTAAFGLAAGLMEARPVAQAGLAVPYYQVSFVIFGAFLLGGLSLLLSEGFGRGSELNKSYRLAVFVMLAGVLLVPVPALEVSILPGESVQLAGYLGLCAVLVSLFVAMAKVTGIDCALSFSAGFSTLFAGELVGVLVGGFAVAALGASESASLGVAALAGALVLLSYIFLFTERDFDELSQIQVEAETFEDMCGRIAGAYGLSARESEILAFALRGRTSERIAQELVISKSTVDTHLRRIYSKCGVHSRQELLDLADTETSGLPAKAAERSKS